jgi:D-xylose transport system permease protein
MKLAASFAKVARLFCTANRHFCDVEDDGGGAMWFSDIKNAPRKFMSNTSQSPALQNEGPVKRFFRATEIDARMLGMLAALVLIWCIFDIASGIMRGNFGGLLGGSFLTPRNLWTLLVQTSSIAVMSTGMVLLIVMRQLDLSVGSMLSMVAVAGAVLQVFKLAPALGVGHPAIWIVGVLACISLGTAVGAFNGWLTAYAKIPAFIVTLGGLLAYSGIAFYMAKGETVAPMDKTFEVFGGGIPASWLGLDHCTGGLRRHYLCHYQRPPPAPALQLSAASGVG